MIVKRYVCKQQPRTRWYCPLSTCTNPTTPILNELIHSFHAPIQFAFAYGSAAFPQQASRAANNNLMLDIILGVNDLPSWHNQNILQFPNHYSHLMRTLGPSRIACLNHSSAGVYYNPYTKFNIKQMSNVFVKYGVIDMNRLRFDLMNWESLYIAGRMHKPIKIITKDTSPQRNFLDLQTENRMNALRLSILLILTNPLNLKNNAEQRNWIDLCPFELYATIAGLSYHGDFRMQFAYFENKYKVRNLVMHQIPEFDSVYRPLMMSLMVNPCYVRWIDKCGPSANQLVTDNGIWQIQKHQNLVFELLTKLPTRFLRLAIMEYKKVSNACQPNNAIDSDTNPIQTCYALADSLHLHHCLERALFQTIAWPALTQSLKGVLTAGLVRTVKYAGAKLYKGYVASRSK